MKKLFLFFTVAAFSVSMQAQVFLDEVFDYNSTKLCNVAGDPNANADPYNLVGVWYNTGKTSNSNSEDFTLVDEPLFYPDYINSGEGKVVKIDWGATAGKGTNERVDVCRFIEHANKIKTGEPIYYAFMMQINNCQSYSADAGGDAKDWRDIFCITEGGSDIPGNSFRGRFWVKTNADDANKFDFATTKNTSLSIGGTNATNMGTGNNGQAYLVVIKQDFNASTVEAILNPAITEAAPTTGWINGDPSDANTFGGTYAIALRRRILGSTADILIGGIRVARSYAGAVGLSTGVKDVLFNDAAIKAIDKTIVTGISGNIKVYSLAGAEVLSASTTGRLDTNLNKGLYLVRFVSTNGAISSSKVEIK